LVRIVKPKAPSRWSWERGLRVDHPAREVPRHGGRVLAVEVPERARIVLRALE
jgi:hypothetical protein